MRNREIICEHYQCAGICCLGKTAEFYGNCQTCQKYTPKKGAKPAREDNRRRKLDKIAKKEKWD